jgi:hypothetical protein
LLQTNAPEEVRRHFGIDADGSFLIDAVAFEATPSAEDCACATSR